MISTDCRLARAVEGKHVMWNTVPVIEKPLANLKGFTPR